MNLNYLKNKYIIGIFIIIAIAIVGNVFYYKNVSNSLKTATAEALGVDAKLRESQAIKLSLQELQDKEIQTRNKYINLCKIFPKNLTQENALNILKSQSDLAKININNISFDVVAPIEALNGLTMNVKFSFKGNYTSIKEFIDLINQGGQKIALKQLTFSGFGSNIAGNAVVAFYGFKSSIVEVDSFQDFSSQGKDDLFKIYSGGEEFTPKAETVATEVPTKNTSSSAAKRSPYDLYVIMNKATDDAANIIIGKNKQSEIAADGNKTNWVNIYFAQQNGKLYFRYRTASDVYPKGKVIEEFTPIGDTIAIKVFSNKILSDADLSKMLLNIYNDTDKKVVITVQGPDGEKRVVKNIFNGDVEIKYE